MKRIVTVAVSIFLLATSVFAQMPPKPSGEHARLAFLVGRWNVEAEEEGIRYTLTESCEWFAGEFQVVCRSEGRHPMGSMRSQTILGYNGRDKSYTRYSHNSFGNATFMTGTVSAQVHTWTGEISIGGQSIKLRATVTEQSPTSYVYKVEGSVAGGPWELVEQGKGTKLQ